ncbi:MAG: PQQ-binding-like beta-propeller repeat protein [Streptosporangiales bacterium]|nr:PQQ-binding-like beta-propeller repeat protein [Streptosporangiales bacterium]
MNRAHHPGGVGRPAGTARPGGAVHLAGSARRRGGALLAALALTALTGLTACSGEEAAEPRSWTAAGLNAVSKVVAGSGVAAVTGLRNGTLQTNVLELDTGRRLWSKPTAMFGRLPGLGVQPPAIAGPAGRPLVATVEQVTTRGPVKAALVAREARTGKERWRRPMHSTFGPARCGRSLCVSENTALKQARFVVLDPATGKPQWGVPGISEVQHADARRIVIFRLARHPVLESRDPRTGKLHWRTSVEDALGSGITLAGGWTFGVSGDSLVGYMAPYRTRPQERMSTFGFFALGLADGQVRWVRPRQVRVYPSGTPATMLVTRDVNAQDGYAGFTVLDPATGRTTARMPATAVPDTNWWLALPERPDGVGFLTRNQPGHYYDLKAGKPQPGKSHKGWAFCSSDPKPLRITGAPGFYPAAAVCHYDLGTGRRTQNTAPPSWYTGSTEGWRLWRDEAGNLNARQTPGTTTVAGMYG